MPDPLAGWPGSRPAGEADLRDDPPPAGHTEPIKPEPDPAEANDPRAEVGQSDVRDDEVSR
jgi:hypothetical protein